MTFPIKNQILAVLIFCVLLGSGVPGWAYYKELPQFHPAPQPGDKKPFPMKNVGPIGIGIEFVSPAFRMKITRVDKGSPAEATGKLKVGQIVEKVNGKPFKDLDPRKIIANAITEAEATDGNLVFSIQGLGDVTIKLPVLGRYSPTWPLNCPKSDKIVRNMADALAKLPATRWGEVLFLLSTGEEKDLEVVKHWMKDLKNIGIHQWDKGYRGIGLAEYYLRTGDESVLPIIKAATEDLRKNMYNGGWSGRGNSAGFTYSTGTGQMHAAGVHCVTFLLLARQCGVDVDEHTLQTSLRHFYRFAGKDNVPYGDGLPEAGYRDNGKTGGLAVAMAAAAQLSHEGERSVYARARDNAAMKSFYATSWFMVAHTGGGIGEIWHNMAMGLMTDKRPAQFQSFVDERRWSYELSRRHDGLFGIAGVDSRYDVTATQSDRGFGTFYAMIYTIPRKHLRLYGAPKTQWSKTYPLPSRPWGTAADDAFLSNEPIRPLIDLTAERVPQDASLPIFMRLNAAPKDDDSVILRYLDHPDYGLRDAAVAQLLKKQRHHLIMPLLRSTNPRLRMSGLLALTGPNKQAPLPPAQWTPEMFDLLEKMIHDPGESWWILHHALGAFGRAEPARIVRNLDRLLELLGHKEWWIRQGAVRALTTISTTPPHYKRIIPALTNSITEARTAQMLNTSAGGLSKSLGAASDEVKLFAFPYFRDAHANFPEQMVDPNNNNVFNGGAKYMRERLIEILFKLPGGRELAARAPKDTLVSAISGKDKDLFVYDGKFRNNPEFAGKWLSFSMVYGDTLDTFNQKSIDKVFVDIERKKKQTGRNRYQPRYLDLKGNSNVGDGGRRDDPYKFWTDAFLVDSNIGEARKMRRFKVGDRTFLAIERSGHFNTSHGVGFHPGYDIYLRE